MIMVEICVGSSCHLKGSEEIVELFRDAIEKNSLNDKVALAGSFCTGKCNRVGVTVTVDGVVYTGITPHGFKEFFEEKVLRPAEALED